eukprot:3247026-Rhodomonas_salina.3
MLLHLYYRLTAVAQSRPLAFLLVLLDTRVKLGRSSGGRSSGVGRSSGLNLEKVFQLAMKMHETFSVTFDRSSDSRQKFRFLSVGTPTGTSAEFNCRVTRDANNELNSLLLHNRVGPCLRLTLLNPSNLDRNDAAPPSLRLCRGEWNPTHVFPAGTVTFCDRGLPLYQYDY